MKKLYGSLRFFVAAVAILCLCCIYTGVLADKIIIPAGVTEIEKEAFYGDTSLDEVVLPEGIKSIGENAFEDSSLQKINLPSSLISIAYNALPISLNQVSVNAEEGSYAYQWAVKTGFIPVVSLTKDKQENVSALGAEYNIEVNANREWDAAPNVDWITINGKAVTDSGKEILAITVAENTWGNKREGNIEFSCGNARTKYWLYQNAGFHVSRGGGQRVALLSVTTEFDWTASTDADWLKLGLESGTYDKTSVSASGNGKVYVLQDYLPVSMTSRTGTVVFTYGGTSYTHTFTQSRTDVPMEDVSITSNVNLITGQTKTLSPTFDPYYATDRRVTWSSSNTSVAKVSSSGKITAVASGTAVIIVKTTDGNNTASCNVKVEPSVKITKQPVDDHMTVEEMKKIVAKMSDREIAYTVTATGAVGYQWQKVSSGQWVDIEGATQSTYRPKLTITNVSQLSQGGYTCKHRCAVTGEDGTVLYTNAVKCNCDLGLNESSGTVNASGGSASVSVTSYSSWTASSNKDWLTIDTDNGTEPGTTVVIMTCSTNTSTSSRTATVTFISGSFTVAYQLTQSAAQTVPKAKITKQPVNDHMTLDEMRNLITKISDREIVYTVTATGAAGYQWQMGSGESWSDVTGATQTTFKPNTTATDLQQLKLYGHTRQYRCAITGQDGAVVYTNTVQCTCDLSLSATAETVEAAKGSTTLTVSSYASWTASCNNSWLTLNTTSGTGTGTASVKLTYSANADTSIRTATVTFTSGSLSAEYMLTQKAGKIYVESIEITYQGKTVKSAYMLKGKRNSSIEVNILPENATDKSVSWTSEDPSIAEIITLDDGKIQLYAKQAGSTRIIVTANDGSGIVYSIPFTVRQPVTKLEITYKGNVKTGTMVMNKGSSARPFGVKVQPSDAFDKSVNWKSDNPSVAEVNVLSDGTMEVYAKGVGSTTLRAVAKDGSEAEATLSVEVQQWVKSIKISDMQPVSVFAGSEGTIHISSILPGDASNKKLKASSSDDSIVEVVSTHTASGSDYTDYITIKGNETGTAVITVEAQDYGGAKITCSVTVKTRSDPFAPIYISSGYADRIVEVACSQIGYTGSGTSGNLTGIVPSGQEGNYVKYAADLDFGNGVSWCAYFVSWCARKADIPTSIIPDNGTASPKKFTNYGNSGTVYYAEEGWWNEDYIYSYGKSIDRSTFVPMKGDLIFFKWSSSSEEPPHHIGIVSQDCYGDMVYYIDGNGRGDVVKERSREKNSMEIVTYVRPHY